jgi:hypothetical protein
MIFNILLLLIVLSLEATIGLPIFFIYLSYQLVIRRKEKIKISALFIISLLLAIFYSLSWPWLALLNFIFYLVWQEISETKLFWKLLSFFVLNLAIFILGKLQFNYFYFVHILIFVFYFYKANFKNYAA